MAFAKTRNPAASNPTPSGIPQGTMGGQPRAAGGRPGVPRLAFDEVQYLWILVLLEVATMGALRKRFRRHHGG